ncbi:MAG: GNAT family N-acetyltransferase [Mucilaginibacter sp.]
MSFDVRLYQPDDAQIWDEFCDDCLQATFLHTRRFLSYHGDRFDDRSLLIEENGKLVGLFPAALSPTDSSLVISHPGITYGGILHSGRLRGERMIEPFREIASFLADQGCTRLLYKAVPSFYHQSPAQDDLYALFILKARRIRCDLSCTIDLKHRLSISDRRNRSLKKANKAGIEIVENDQYLSLFWDVLSNNLAKKYEAKPVHTLAELGLLMQRFPGNIRCISAILNGAIVAGVILFITSTAHHAQYIAATDEGYKVSALDLVFDYCINNALKQQKNWFDFGISNEDHGLILNESLYRFKSEFGGGGWVHEFYELEI